MPKYVYSEANGAVYSFNPKAKPRAHMKPMTDIEAKVYDKYIVELKKAIAEDRRPLPRQPVFPMTNVVADIEAEEVIIESSKPEPKVEQVEAAIAESAAEDLFEQG